MKQLTKENLISFKDNYHDFHDSYVKDVIYDFKKSHVDILLEVWWVGERIKKEYGTYEPNKIRMRLSCNNVFQYNFKEIFSDYIDEAFLKYVKIKDKEYICFATDNKEPLISVICENMEYEELG